MSHSASWLAPGRLRGAAGGAAAACPGPAPLLPQAAVSRASAASPMITEAFAPPAVANPPRS